MHRRICVTDPGNFFHFGTKIPHRADFTPRMNGYNRLISTQE
jgi:hypothetical protein